MAFGNFISVDMPTQQGEFKIYVLAELVELGRRDGKPVATFLEHYVLMPTDRMFLDETMFHVHTTDIFKDLFIPACKGEQNLPQQILKQLSRTKDGLFLHMDRLEPEAFAALQEGLDEKADFKPASIEAIVRKFAGHPEISVAPLIGFMRTDPPEKLDRIDSVAIHRQDKVVDIDVPLIARQAMFPDIAANTVFRKNLSHFALVNNEDHNPEMPPYVRIDSLCETGHLYLTARCDCGGQFRMAMQEVAGRGGAIVLDPTEGRGTYSTWIKIFCHAIKEAEGGNTYDSMVRAGYRRHPDGYGPDLRTFEGAAELLKFIGMTSIILATQNGYKERMVRGHGIDVLGTTNVQVDEESLTPEMRIYLRAKAKEGGHNFSEPFRQALRCEPVVASGAGGDVLKCG